MASPDEATARALKPNDIPPDGLVGTRRWLAYSTIIMGLSLAALDGTIVNIALPSLSREFEVSAASSIWLVNIYQLVVAMLLLPLASIGEIYGYRRVYLAGLVLFGFSSTLCALSSGLWQLVAARGLQGIAAACIMSVNTALVRYIFSKARLGGAIRANAIIVAIAATLGPGIASFILSVADWPWLFAVNIPLCIAGFAFGLRNLPQSHRAPRKFDFKSALELITAFGLTISALSAIAHGADIFVTIVLGIGGVAGLTWLIRGQLGLTHPMLPLDLLANPVFRFSICASVGAFCAQLLAFVALPFHLEHQLGFDVSRTGLLLMAWPIMVGIGAPIAGRLTTRFHAGVIGAIGMACMAAGLVLLYMVQSSESEIALVWRLALCGFGFGLFQSPNNHTMMSAAPLERSGSASGMLGTARLTGQSLGAALAALLIGRLGEHGTAMSLLTAAGFCVMAGFFSARRIRAAREMAQTRVQ